MNVLVLNPPREIAATIPQLVAPHTIHNGNYSSLEIVFTHTGVTVYCKGVDIRDFDFTWVSASWTKRDVAFAISLYLQQHGKKHTVVGEGQGHSKLVDMMYYALHKIPQPRSYYCTKFSYPAHIDAIIKACGLPVIAKDVYGTYGRNCFLARTRQELIQALRNDTDEIEYVFQEYMEHDFDWGILVGNNEVLSAERTYRPPQSPSFMNHNDPNITEVFEAPENVPATVNKIALKANKILGLQWGRSDIIHNRKDNKPYILETNRSPRITSDSTEVTAYGKYLNSLLSSI